MTGESTSATVVTGAEAEAVANAYVRPQPAAELKQLDFLLGDFHCEYTNLASNPPTAGTAEFNTRAIDGGHFYEMTQLIPVPGLECTLIFGWDPVHHRFVVFYHDDLGNHGTATSAGWDAGHLRFTGDYVVDGKAFVFQEDFSVAGPGHYLKNCFVRNGDDWTQVDRIECFRSLAA
jgi:hypothetical protein